MGLDKLKDVSRVMRKTLLEKLALIETMNE